MPDNKKDEIPPFMRKVVDDLFKTEPYDPDRCLVCGEKHGSGNLPCPRMTPMC